MRARLIEFLLTRPRAANKTDVSIGMTQQQLAEELGTVREVVSRELRRLSCEKFIASLRGGRYRLLDLHALRDTVDESTG